jgi:hypothetical protein
MRVGGLAMTGPQFRHRSYLSRQVLHAPESSSSACAFAVAAILRSKVVSLRDTVTSQDPNQKEKRRACLRRREVDLVEQQPVPLAQRGHKCALNKAVREAALRGARGAPRGRYSRSKRAPPRREAGGGGGAGARALGGRWAGRGLLRRHGGSNSFDLQACARSESMRLQFVTLTGMKCHFETCDVRTRCVTALSPGAWSQVCLSGQKSTSHCSSLQCIFYRRHCRFGVYV